jgi:hypothetical protein
MRGAFLGICICLLSAMAADVELAGRYSGEWKSSGPGNGGGIRFALAHPAGSPWTCDLTFTLDGADVKTVMREVKVQDAKVEFTYDFDVQGATLRSHVTGEWNGTAFRGSYQTTVSDGSAGVDSGTWSAAKAK